MNYFQVLVWPGGGAIGLVIWGLSLVTLAVIIELCLAVRRRNIAPDALLRGVRDCCSAKQYRSALDLTGKNPSFVARVIHASLREAPHGYAAMERAMEEAGEIHATRIVRRVEWLNLIGNIAPMLGLLGTVWGMIIAFMEFEVKANPAPSELAPGIYKALVTTLQGLCVAIPALAAYAILRNRTDELVAETSLAAEHAFSVYKRGGLKRKADPAPDPRRAVRRPETHDDRTGAGE